MYSTPMPDGIERILWLDYLLDWKIIRLIVNVDEDGLCVIAHVENPNISVGASLGKMWTYDCDKQAWKYVHESGARVYLVV